MQNVIVETNVDPVAKTVATKITVNGAVWNFNLNFVNAPVSVIKLLANSLHENADKLA
jgi:hypothetical protein